MATTAQATPGEALSVLQAGNGWFTKGQAVHEFVGSGLRRTLARGQKPYAVVLSCTDSRVPPEHVFSTGVGDLFVVRVAGNVVSPEALASIEYAVEHLGAQLCVVMGHESCGAVGACVDRAEQARTGQPEAAPSPALERLLRSIEPAARQALDQELGGKELRDQAEREHARNMAVECLRRSQLLRRLHELGRFEIRPARYMLETGRVNWLPAKPLPVPAATPAKKPTKTASSFAPHTALRMLQAGHRRFLGSGRPTGDISIKRREALALGQQPLAIVVSCADSRVVPEHIFDAGLGELVVVRIAGNMLTNNVLASIEYAATHTGAPLLVVMGHSSCDTLRAALGDRDVAQLTPNQRALQDRLEPVVQLVRNQGDNGSDLLDLAVRANVLRFLQQARRLSPILQQLEDQGRFSMLPAVYDLATGDMQWLAVETPANPKPVPGPNAAPIGETQAAVDQDHTATRSDHGAPEPDAPATMPGHDADPAHGIDIDATRDLRDDRPHQDGGHSHATDPRHEEPVHGDEPAAAHATEPRGPSLVTMVGIAGIMSLLGALWVALRGRR